VDEDFIVKHLTPTTPRAPDHLKGPNRLEGGE
jgi:hypothetical protein